MRVETFKCETCKKDFEHRVFNCAPFFRFCSRSCASIAHYPAKAQKLKDGASRVSKGKILSTETKKKLSHSLRALGPEWGRKISQARKLSSKTPRGETHWKWKGGLNHQTVRRSLIYKSEGQHTLKQWEALKLKYNYMCLCCKKQEPLIKLAADHIVPLSVGGSNDISNIQPLCKSCNSRKHTQTINYAEQFQI